MPRAIDLSTVSPERASEILRNETPDLDFFKKKAKKGARRG